ncbi:polysaccharide deacetylase family protein [Pseudosporangium ferrugineum]|uniref:Peptidoglycan/xylan/chitin deacetylase (PgdA/CDA1 family) n=1 Tax=Pseudosporangium ferrugineum TaxID=439699 RepID=A0A2T0S3J2_9ACTN|nr:polysaccharide deacetylase family protein [Pseudosporangium ferrugineum]PRY27972.1 peptidoglycan/xylan/chitin deacetylase (PgdA/CDA1 family) [Pseudosporangium ferrugineum]
MRTLMIGVALAGLLGLAGCGTAVATEGRPSWVAAAPAAPSPSASRPPEVVVSQSPSHSPAHSASPSHVPASVVTERAPHKKKRHQDGPADSLMKTGQAGVALTFDDGPDPVQTPKMLDLLARTHVKATFCLVGQNVAAHPDLVRRIAAEGHTLCNHSWRHSLTLGRQKPSVIRADLQRTNDAIRAAVPGATIGYMRAPGGNFTPAFVAEARKLGMTSIYWQVDPRDWEHRPGEPDGAHEAKVIRAVKKHVGKGAIVLSHDYGQPDTIRAYEKLIPWLKQRYTLIALP